MNSLVRKISTGILGLGFALSTTYSSVNAQGNRPIGTWKDFFPYENAFEVAPADGVVYARTEFAIFSIDLDANQVERHSIVQGLSGSNPTSIATAPLGTNDGHVLIVGYGDGNIDLITETGVYNMPDIVNSNLIGDKAIRNIYVESPKAYLSTSFGVVVIDISEVEVSDTWYIQGQ